MHNIGIKFVFVLLILGGQNTAGLITILFPNNCSAVRSDASPRLDKRQLEQSLIRRQNISIAAMGSALLDSYEPSTK